MEEQLEARKASFRERLSEGVRDQIKDFEFGNLGDVPVDKEEPESDPIKIVELGDLAKKEELQSDPILDIGLGEGEGSLVDEEMRKRIQRLPLLKDLKNKESIKQAKFAQEVQRLAKLNPGSGREGRRLAKRSGLFGRKHESATKKLAEYEEEIAKLE